MPIGMVSNDPGNKRGRGSSAQGSGTGGTNNSGENTKQRRKQQTTASASAQQAQQTEDLYDSSIPDDYSELQSDSQIGKMKIIAAVVVAVLVIVVLVFVKTRSSGGITDDAADATSTEEDSQGVVDSEPDEEYDDGAVYNENGDMVYNEDGEVVDKDAIDPGVPNYDSEQSETTATVYSASDFIKDLNGIKVPAVYNVASRDYVFDYVNYTAKRAVMDDGMELYWLDVLYNDKKYRVQVPFYRFKDLKASGICKVQIEVLTLDGGGKIISWMQVVDDSAGVEQ